ncbi:integrase core domain-containing protein [Microbacterium sp. NPDC086615]|uniref:integrase core domain-containing protein n=1 Tax=Microbacterium sp. NPDC086615 TaxID=3154865 RepID=UPI00343CFC7D
MTGSIDDHSRLALASHVSWAETADAAITVMDKAIAAHGVPQRLLSDNGAALNPTRRGMTGKLVTHVTALGVLAITGKPYKPTTQGKNERFHQTLFRFLDKQPLADTLDDLQQHVDAFDRIYNTERPHQALPGRLTPPTSLERHRPRTPSPPSTRIRHTRRKRHRPTHPNRHTSRSDHHPQHPIHDRQSPRRHHRPRDLEQHHRRHLRQQRHTPDHLPQTTQRHPLRRQWSPPTPPNQTQSVTDVLIHQPSPMS